MWNNLAIAVTPMEPRPKTILNLNVLSVTARPYIITNFLNQIVVNVTRDLILGRFHSLTTAEVALSFEVNIYLWPVMAVIRTVTLNQLIPPVPIVTKIFTKDNSIKPVTNVIHLTNGTSYPLIIIDKVNIR